MDGKWWETILWAMLVGFGFSVGAAVAGVLISFLKKG